MTQEKANELMLQAQSLPDAQADITIEVINNKHYVVISADGFNQRYIESVLNLARFNNCEIDTDTINANVRIWLFEPRTKQANDKEREETQEGIQASVVNV